MLKQRSEIEQFFLEALEQIKEEIRKKIAVERKQKRQEFSNPNGGGSMAQPKVGEGSMLSGSHDPSKMSQK